jgi:hypothetical protein
MLYREIVAVCLRFTQTKPEFSLQIFEKYSRTKSHDNPYSGSRVVHACWRTDMSKPKVFLKKKNFVNAPKKYKSWSCLRLINPYPANVENVVIS